MGAGASARQIYRIKYNSFQTMLRQVRSAGGSGSYKDQEINCILNGHTIQVYYGRTLRASNGECCAFLVIHFDDKIYDGSFQDAIKECLK